MGVAGNRDDLDDRRIHMRLLLAATAVAVLAACSSTADDRATLLAASIEVERAPVDPASPVDELVAAINETGLDLLVAQPDDAASVLSPISIVRTVLMARAAADGPTGEAIDAALGLPTGDAAHEAWNALDAELRSAAGTAEAFDGTPTPVVELAGRIWPTTTAEPDQAWIDLLARFHGADVETIDAGDPSGSRDRINEWVAGRTNDLIPELLPEGFIDGRTELVLTDAVYFRAEWRTIFGKYGPETGPFTRLDGSEVDVEYLVDLEQPGPRGAGDGWVGAQIPYLGDEFAMVLIVPDGGRFAELRQRLADGLLDEVDATMTTGPFELRMPEWSTDASIDLAGWLTEIGAAPGRYPGIGPGVVLEDGVHGADITVDEVGTEAAAATALDFTESGPPEPELVVAAERP
ncbi:MAG: serpin family protein, partial [Actinomycetota bacterium]